MKVQVKKQTNKKQLYIFILLRESVMQAIILLLSSFQFGFSIEANKTIL